LDQFKNLHSFSVAYVVDTATPEFLYIVGGVKCTPHKNQYTYGPVSMC